MNRIAGAFVLPLLTVTCLALGACNAPSSPVVSATAPRNTEHVGHESEHEHLQTVGEHSKHRQGGSQADEEDLDTYAAALRKIDSLRSAIKDAFAAKDLDKADAPVHEVGHLLEKLPALASKEKLSAEDQSAVKQAVDELFASFGKIDDKLHGGQGNTYEDVARQVDAAMETLQAKSPVKEQ